MVVTLLGILAAIGAVKLSGGLAGNLSSGTDSTRMLFALRQARAAAINTRDDHIVTLISAGGLVTGFQIERVFADNTTQIVEGPYSFSDRIQVTATGGSPRFNFQGEATTAPVVTFQGDDRTDRITVVSATGWGLLEEL